MLKPASTRSTIRTGMTTSALSRSSSSSHVLSCCSCSSSSLRCASCFGTPVGSGLALKHQPLGLLLKAAQTHLARLWCSALGSASARIISELHKLCLNSLGRATQLLLALLCCLDG